MFELNLDAGTANAEPSAAPVDPASATPSDGVAADTAPAMDPGFDTGGQVEPPVSSLTPQQDPAPSDPAAPADEVEPPLTPADPEAELLAAANDPNTPKWARSKIQEAMSYAGTLKERAAEAERQAAELRTQFDGKQVVNPADIERMRAMEDRIIQMQSFAAKPEDLERQLIELNPRAYPELRDHMVWSALERPDGTPDYENLQTIVDRFSGQPGSVDAKDLLAAVEALRDGTIKPADLKTFSSDEEREIFERNQSYSRQLEERAQAIEQNAKFQETQIRTAEVQGLVGEMQREMEAQIMPLMERFKLMPVPGEPKAATDYKARVNERIAQVVNSAPANIRALGEIVQAIEILKQPGKKPVDAQTAVAEVRQFAQSMGFQHNKSRAMSDLISQVERVIAEEARYYKLIMLGLEAENSKPQQARPVIGSPNQTANLPNLTEADLASMSAAQRAEQSALRLTQELRNSRFGASRLGQ